MEIDYVFPWVNDNDPVWRKVYEDYCLKTQSYVRLQELHNERYRDWGLLKYLLRSIDFNMPWIRKVHLIVSNIEQVPVWINQEKVHIVLHSDFIPEKFLPLYNSTAIEMFLDKIPDLAEHFLYGNDDIFFLKPTQPSDWFTEEGKFRFGLRQLKGNTMSSNQFKLVCSRQWWKLRQALQLPVDYKVFYRPVHGVNPLSKTMCQAVWDLLGADSIYKTITHFRDSKNMNQYVYTDYIELIGLRDEPTIQFEYLAAKNAEMVKMLKESTADVVCINDCKTNWSALQITKLQILTAKVFEEKFSMPCKYEK